MSKICIKSVLKSSQGVHIYEGKAIKKDNQIIYNDEQVMTIITFDETIKLERKKDYHMKLGFRTGEKVDGTYIIPEGNLIAQTNTEKLIITEKGIKIIYSLMINNTFIDNFELNLSYSIDS